MLQQCAHGLVKGAASRGGVDDESLQRQLESVKHYLWHGNSHDGLQRLEWTSADLTNGAYCEQWPQEGSAGAKRMLKYVREMKTYISNNAAAIVNYGERYRNGERISTAFVESTINQVVSKRMVKKQQMQWTPQGAHLLLQVRTAVLNEE